MFFAQAHYRSPPDFSEKALTDVEKGRERLYRVKERLQEFAQGASGKEVTQASLQDLERSYRLTIKEMQCEFEAAMDDDFNTPKAFASLFEFVNKSNRFFEQQPDPNPDLCQYALDVFLKAGMVLTMFQPQTHPPLKKQQDVLTALQTLLQTYGKPLQTPTIETILQVLLDARQEARKKKDYKTADDIRKNLESLGFEIQDTAVGPVWRKK
jgi:cysteinyl-tRNA synthetase